MERDLMSKELNPNPMGKELTLPAGGDAIAPIVPRDFGGVRLIADVLAKAGMAPKGMERPEQLCVAIMHGLEVGLTPMAAVQSIAVIGGRPTVWGDGALALVQASGLLVDMDERLERRPETDGGPTAICAVTRKGRPTPIIREFSMSAAQRAGLTGKSGPWRQYPARMLRMRARAWALRDGFADVLRGLAIREEIADVTSAPQASASELLDRASEGQAVMTRISEGLPPREPAADSGKLAAPPAGHVLPAEERGPVRRRADEVDALTAAYAEAQKEWESPSEPAEESPSGVAPPEELGPSYSSVEKMIAAAQSKDDLMVIIDLMRDFDTKEKRSLMALYDERLSAVSQRGLL